MKNSCMKTSTQSWEMVGGQEHLGTMRKETESNTGSIVLHLEKCMFFVPLPQKLFLRARKVTEEDRRNQIYVQDSE